MSRKQGTEILQHPDTNKGTAFSMSERRELGLEGLVPPAVLDQTIQADKLLELFHRIESDLDKHVFLNGLADRNERLFYHLVINNFEEMLPILYTPTVGEACRRYSNIFRRPRGMYLGIDLNGRLEQVLRNWEYDDVRVICVTDGERILGLGDLGVNGMGIPIGKLALYTAAAHIDPNACLPIILDVGTNNQELLDDPVYLGLRQQRVSGAAYDSFVDEFIDAAQKVFPKALIQFEDFANPHAIPLLRRYRDRVRCFNDDMQGTAAVAVAGLFAACRLKKTRLRDEKILFLGAGTAGTGIADLTVAAMVEQGLPVDEARSRIWFVDVNGLVVESRRDLAEHNLPYAHDHAPLSTLQEAVDALQPTALIGVSGVPKLFTESVVKAMAANNERPIVFPLSNPTSRAECTAAQAYAWTEGRVIFASGSPFGPVEVAGKTYRPGQGNNVYIFPGLGLGVVASGARIVPDEMFAIAANVLAEHVSDESLARGTIYPPLSDLDDVSRAIARATATYAFDTGLATVDRPDDLDAHLASFRYDPSY